MKKQIKDFTFGEFDDLCFNDKIDCKRCPFNEDEFCPLYHNEILEKEVEVDE